MMKEIPIDAKVECTDGPCGHSTYLIVNPVKKRVTHFVVKDDKLPGSSDRLVPVEKVADTTSSLISLSCTRAAVADMKPFTTTHYVQEQVPDSRFVADPYVYVEPMVVYNTETVAVPEHQIPHDELAVYRGMTVRTNEGQEGKVVGTVDELVVDPDSGDITHLLMLKGHLWAKKDVAIPVSAIYFVGDDDVFLNIDHEAVGALPTVPVKRH